MRQMKQWMLAAILILCGAMTAWAQTSYDYFYRSWDADKKEVKTEIRTCTSYTAINGSDTSDSGWLGLYSGWYVVTGNSNYKTLNVLGDDVHLIIPDMVTLTLTGGVKLETGKKLTIYSQGGDVGQLIATNDYSGAAGIGGGSGESCGDLIIHGGIVKATGGEKGAGIGGGKNQGFYGGLTIYGGTVTAQGGQYGAGIGSGDENESNVAGYITIYGGTVTATGGEEAAGIMFISVSPNDNAKANDSNAKDETLVSFMFQATALGAEFGGEAFRGFIEAGLGEKGLLCAGQRYKF